jgi:hypothetical protein
LARPASSEAMGGASAAGAQASDSILSNPAGLSSLGPQDSSDLTISYNNLLAQSYLGYVAYGRSCGRFGALGASVVYFSQAPLQGYDVRGDASGTFRPQDMAMAFSYAHRLTVLSLGANVKMIRSSVDDRTGTTMALDFGIQAKNVALVGDRPVDVGGYLSHFGPPIKVGSVSAALPVSWNMGMLWHTTPVIDSSLDLHLTSDQDPYVSLGFEANFPFDRLRRKAMLRFGYDQSHTRDIDGLSGIAAGAGLDLEVFRLDYAWIPLGELGITHRVSLGFSF